MPRECAVRHDRLTLRILPRRRSLFIALLLALVASVILGEAGGKIEEIKTLLKAGKYAEAEVDARALLAKVAAESGDDSAEAAGVQDLLVESLWRGGKAADPEARELAERAVRIKERAFGAEHPEVATSLSNLGMVFKSVGDHAAARPLYERALAIREKTLGLDHPDVAVSVNQLANLLRNTGDYSAARPLYERALAMREKALGPEHSDVAVSLNNLANLLTDLGDYAAARLLYERALAIREKALGSDHPFVATTLNNLAILSWTIDADYAAARPLYERALAIREKALGPDHPDVAAGLGNLANMLRDVGDYAAARPLYERALTIREKALGPDHPQVAESLTTLANLSNDTGDHAAARPLYERALAIWEKALGPDHPRVAMGLANLARELQDTGDYSAARPLDERALAIFEKAFGPDHPEVALTMNNLAYVLEDMGDDSAAGPLLERSLAIRQKALGPDHPSVAQSLDSLARLHVLRGEASAALEAALEVERIGREHLKLTSRSLSERQALRYAAARNSNLNLLLTLAGRGIDGASRRRVLDAVVRSRALVFEEMAARHRAIAAADPGVARLAEDLTRVRYRLANLVVRGPGDQSAEVYRKLVDEAREEKEQAERALAGASASFSRELSLSRLGIDEVSASLPSGSALVAIVLHKRIDLEALRSRSDAMAAGTNLKDVPAVSGRPDGSAATSRDVPWFLAFVLHAGEQYPSVVSLGPAKEIDPLVTQWRKEVLGAAPGADQPLKEAEASYRRAGANLRKRVWDPLELKDEARVFVVPDGSLNLVNMAALPVDGGGYLVEHGSLVHYLSTERDLVPSKDVRRGQGILVLGSPAYDWTSLSAGSDQLREKPRPETSAHASGTGHGVPLASGKVAVSRAYRGGRSSCADFKSVRFDPLPGTGREADEVSHLWKGKKTAGAMQLTGSAASEAAFKEKAPGRRVLHLATHGFFLGGRCASALDSPASVKGRPLTSEDLPLVTGENPLVLSGLALAGANHRASANIDEEDGILTAEEVASMDLLGVEWAVLSACDTGVGEIKAGEGVFGLRRAFQVAGAQTVIMSLWSVEDEATRAWMRNLYEERLRGASTAEAVRSASRRMIESLRRSGLPPHPYFWAGFVAAGSWR